MLVKCPSCGSNFTAEPPTAAAPLPPMARSDRERTRRRAAELACDADLRMNPPLLKTATDAEEAAPTRVLRFQSDDRLPLPGTVITRAYKGEQLQVKVLPHGFEFEGEVYKLLSAWRSLSLCFQHPTIQRILLRCRRKFLVNQIRFLFFLFLYQAHYATKTEMGRQLVIIAELNERAWFAEFQNSQLVFLSCPSFPEQVMATRVQGERCGFDSVLAA
jgi:hypothetical protein